MSHENPRFTGSYDMHALIIGINEYSSGQHGRPDTDATRLSSTKFIPNLAGAVADATSIQHYLKGLGVPERNIVMLRNQEASRQRILRELRNLKINKRIKRDAPIFIYFAGHGAEGVAPADWHNGDSRMQCILPQDFSFGPEDTGEDANTGEMCVHAIPDRTLGFLLNEIADAKGDNITVILDCCFSGGANRKAVALPPDPTLRRRGIVAPIPLSTNIDSDISIPRRVRVRGKDETGHMMLSACSAKQSAWERSGNGLFTKILLEALSNVGSDCAITYRELFCAVSAHRDLKGVQTPQCVGFAQDRYLFQRSRAIAEPPFIIKKSFARNSGQGSKDSTDQYTLSAGEIHGITAGSEVEIYQWDKTKVSSAPEAKVCLETAGTIEAIISLPKSLQLLEGRALRIVSLRVHVGSDPTLDPLRRDLEQGRSRFLGSAGASVRLTGCKTPDDANVQVNTIGGKLVFSLPLPGVLTSELATHQDDLSVGWGHRLFKVIDRVKIHIEVALGLRQRISYNTKVPTLCFPCPASLSNEAVQRVLYSAATFTWHLLRCQSSRPFHEDSISLAFIELVKGKGRGVSQYGYVPENERDLVEDGAVHLKLGSGSKSVEGSKYGLKILSHIQHPLFIAVFLFDSDLTIRRLDLPSYAIAKGKRAASLQAAGSSRPAIFTIGYGNSGVPPLEFYVPDDMDEEVSFLKVFVSTEQFDLSYMAQKSSLPEQTEDEESANSSDEDEETTSSDDDDDSDDFQDAEDNLKPRKVKNAGKKVEKRPALWDVFTIPVFQRK